MKIIAKYFIHFRDISGAEHDMTELIIGDISALYRMKTV